MILIGLGSNLSGPWGTPREALQEALQRLDRFPLRLVKASTIKSTDPFGVTNQPTYVNAAAVIETALSPESLIRKLHLIEREAGRRRGRRWGPRTLDLDILDYHGCKRRQHGAAQKALVLPHPGMAQRRFVLQPLDEVAPRWRHPVLRRTAAEMIHKL